jgi:multidrug efflux pump subunit AcrB
MEDIRKGIAAATLNQAKGTIEGKSQALILDANDQLFQASGYRDVIVAFRNGAPVRIRDIAEVIDGARLPRTGAWYNNKKAEVLLILRQPGANITRIVDQVRAATCRNPVPRAPPSLHVDLMSDRSLAVEASIADVKFTLVLHHRPGGDGDLFPCATSGRPSSLDRRCRWRWSPPSPSCLRWATASTTHP